MSIKNRIELRRMSSEISRDRSQDKAYSDSETSKHEMTKSKPSSVNINCPICNQTFYKPRILPCLHTFCSPCLEKSQNEEKSLKCFTCRMEFSDLKHGIQSFLPDYTTMNLVYSHRGKIFCTGCVSENATAVYRCVTCNNFLCDYCTQAHRKLLIFNKHSVMGIVTHDFEEEEEEIGGATAEEEAEGAGAGAVVEGEEPYGRLTKCLTHKTESVAYFCYSCHAAVCETCAGEEHARESHALEPLSVVSENIGQLMSRAVEMGKNKLREFMKVQSSDVERLDSEYRGNQQKITDWYERFVVLLNRYKEEQLNRLDSYYAKFLMELYVSRKINRTSDKINAIKELHVSLKIYIAEVNTLCTTISDVKIRKTIRNKLKIVGNNLQFIPKAKDIFINLIRHLSFFINSSNSKGNSMKNFFSPHVYAGIIPSQNGSRNLSTNLISTHKILTTIEKFLSKSHKHKDSDLRAVRHKKKVIEIIEKLVKNKSLLTHPSRAKVGGGVRAKPKSHFPGKSTLFDQLLKSGTSSRAADYSDFDKVEPTCLSGEAVETSGRVDVSKSTSKLEVLEGSETSFVDGSKDFLEEARERENPEEPREKPKEDAGVRKTAEASCQTTLVGDDPKLSSLDGSIYKPTVDASNAGSLKSEVTRCTMYYHNKFGLFSGTMIGQFFEPNGVAVNESGDIIVADTNNNRIQVFNMSGKFKFKFGHDGRLLYPNRVAVMQTTGEIIVSERAPTPQIQIFDKNGKFLRLFGSDILKFPRGLAVDNDGNIIVAESKIIRVTIFNLDGKLTSMFYSDMLRFPISVDVNNQGEIFICDNLAHCVLVFNYSGLFLRRIGEEGITNYPFAVAVSPSGEVFIADNHNSFNLSIFTKNGHLLSALKGKSKHLQCLDIAIGRSGSLVLTSKDNRIYVYSYAFY